MLSRYVSYFGGGGVVTYSIVCKMLNMRFAGPMKTGIKWILSLKLCCSKKKFEVVLCNMLRGEFVRC